jgi:hypothetical protein
MSREVQGRTIRPTDFAIVRGLAMSVIDSTVLITSIIFHRYGPPVVLVHFAQVVVLLLKRTIGLVAGESECVNRSPWAPKPAA